MKEVKKEKKNCSLYFLKIDFSLTPRGRLTGRQVGVWIEGGRGLKEEGRLFQTQKQMKEVFWQNRQPGGNTHYAHTVAHTPSNKHKPALAKNPDFQITNVI